MLWNPAAPFIRTYWRYAQEAAPALHVSLQSEEATQRKDFERAFDNMVRDHSDALFVLSDSLMSSNRVTLAQLAADRKIPALYGHNLYTEAGGLNKFDGLLDRQVRWFCAFEYFIDVGGRASDQIVYRGSVTI